MYFTDIEVFCFTSSPPKIPSFDISLKNKFIPKKLFKTLYSTAFKWMYQNFEQVTVKNVLFDTWLSYSFMIFGTFICKFSVDWLGIKTYPLKSFLQFFENYSFPTSFFILK